MIIKKIKEYFNINRNTPENTYKDLKELQNIKNKYFEELQILKETQENIMNSIYKIIENEEQRILFFSIFMDSPVLQWAKDTNNVYTFANKNFAKSISDILNPEDIIGLSDKTLSKALKKEYKNWDFENTCKKTDDITLQTKQIEYFYYFGKAKDKLEYILIMKNVYRDKYNIAGVSGLGYIITERVRMLMKILNLCENEENKKNIEEYLRKYFGFKEQNFFVDKKNNLNKYLKEFKNQEI